MATPRCLRLPRAAGDALDRVDQRLDIDDAVLQQVAEIGRVRFAGDESRRHLYRWGEPLVDHFDPDRRRHARRQIVKRRRESAVGENRRTEAVGQLTECTHCLLRLVDSRRHR
jgi:hypothetical protein